MHPNSGDYLWLVGPKRVDIAGPKSKANENNLGIGNFREEAGARVSVSLASKADADDQEVKISFLGDRKRRAGGLVHPVRLVPNHAYRVRVRARSSIPGASIRSEVVYYGKPKAVGSDKYPLSPQRGHALSAESKEYVFELRTPDGPWVGTDLSIIRVEVAAKVDATSPGDVYIDTVEFDDLSATTAFLPDVERILREGRPGVLRFYGIAELGTTASALTAESAVKSPWTYISYDRRYVFFGLDAVIDDWMELCERVGADPWITVGGGNTPFDWTERIQYLSAPPFESSHSDRRTAHGHSMPWVTRFDPTYLGLRATGGDHRAGGAADAVLPAGADGADRGRLGNERAQLERAHC